MSWWWITFCSVCLSDCSGFGKIPTYKVVERAEAFRQDCIMIDMRNA